MSAFLIRRKRFIVAFLVSFVLTSLVLFGLIYIFRASIYEIVRKESLMEAKHEVVVLNKPMKKGEKIAESDISRIVVESDIADKLSEADIIGKRLALNLLDNIPISRGLVEVSELDDRDRLYEFSFISMPTKLSVSDVVDVRIRFQNGEDYLVASKKEVYALSKAAQEGDGDFIQLALDENEILAMSSAFVDSLANELSEVYLVKYNLTLDDKASVCNYPLNEAVAKLFKDNPNIAKGSDIEDSIKTRIRLDDNLAKIIFENRKLVNYSHTDMPAISALDAKAESQDASNAGAGADVKAGGALSSANEVDSLGEKGDNTDILKNDVDKKAEEKSALDVDKSAQNTDNISDVNANLGGEDESDDNAFSIE